MSQKSATRKMLGPHSSWIQSVVIGREKRKWYLSHHLLNYLCSVNYLKFLCSFCSECWKSSRSSVSWYEHVFEQQFKWRPCKVSFDWSCFSIVLQTSLWCLFSFGGGHIFKRRLNVIECHCALECHCSCLIERFTWKKILIWPVYLDCLKLSVVSRADETQITVFWSRNM